MISPLTREQHIDVVAVKQVVNHLITAHVDGLFVLGTTGEARRLNDLQKRALVEQVVPLVKGHCTTYAGISSNSIVDSVQAAHTMHGLGIEYAVSHPPMHVTMSDSELEDYFSRIADAIPMPLILYNMPRITGVSIPIHRVESLSRHPNIVGIKDSENNAPRLAMLLESVGGRSDFVVLVGCAALSADGLRRGAHGLVPSTANLFPDLYRTMCDAAQRGEWDVVQRLQVKSDTLSAQYQHGRELDDSLIALKQLMNSHGLCGPTTVIRPMRVKPVGEQV
jgi:4-hydroxy-tetrahydrodipicolinate synthase